MDRRFFGIIIAVIAVLIGVFALTGGNKDKSGDKAAGVGQVSNHVSGPNDAKVTLIEYGDYQCPACKSYFPIVEQIRSDYKDRLKFQFRNFPLVQIHPNAFIGARAAEAAGKQNKYFEMHDLLYQNQDAWSASSNPSKVLESYATQLGINVDKFRTDMNSSETASTINADVKAGQSLGANSTPTFVINGKKVDKNPQSIDDFKKLIDDAFSQKQ